MTKEIKSINMCPVCGSKFSYEHPAFGGIWGFSCNHMVFEGTRTGNKNNMQFAIKAIKKFWRKVPKDLKQDSGFDALLECEHIDFFGSESVACGRNVGTVYRGFNASGVPEEERS